MLEIRPVVCPHRRAAAVRSAATVCYKRITADQAETRYTMCCCFRTAPTTFTWTCRGRQGEVGQRYGILLLATDAARRPGLNVVLCGDRLFQQYVFDACAKMEQQRLDYLRFNQPVKSAVISDRSHITGSARLSSEIGSWRSTGFRYWPHTGRFSTRSRCLTSLLHAAVTV